MDGSNFGRLMVVEEALVEGNDAEKLTGVAGVLALQLHWALAIRGVFTINNIIANTVGYTRFIGTNFSDDRIKTD
jgi:hypothetical protein